MIWYQIFQDGPEYEARKKKGTFTPPNLSLKDVRDAVPPHLFERSTTKSLFYIIRHLGFTVAFYYFATKIDEICNFLVPIEGSVSYVMHRFLRTALWVSYWGWQGVTFAGIWCLGHEAGHDALSPYPWVNNVLGMFLHTFVLTPYFAWRATHRTHHKTTNNIERDETYIPPTRKDFKLPDGKVAVRMNYAEILEETPAFTLFKLFVRQFFGFQLYLMLYAPAHRSETERSFLSVIIAKAIPDILLGRAIISLPPYYSDLTKVGQGIIISNIAMSSMLFLLGLYAYKTSWASLRDYYIYPWLMCHNWMVMFTYLQHSDPTVPYYRKDQWTFARGALATVDRPLFGWVGTFFFHNISTDHVAHHFFVSVPFYNLPAVTEAIKPVLGEYYNYDSTPVLAALWRSFTQCTFVENEGDILFFKNQYGESVLEPANHQ